MYSNEIKPPVSKRQGLANVIQMAINNIEALEVREALLMLVGLLDDVCSKSNPYRLDTTGETTEPDEPCIAVAGTLQEADRLKLDTTRPTATVSPTFPLYAAIAAVDIAKVPVVCTDRHIPRKQQAALTRQLFKQLGLKGISVTTPNYSMASVVDIEIPCEPHPGWDGYVEWSQASYGDMPSDVPAKQWALRFEAAKDKVIEILVKAFPNHDDRSDSQSEHFDFKWSII